MAFGKREACASNYPKSVDWHPERNVQFIYSCFLFIGLSVYHHMYFILKYFKAEMRKGLMQPQPDLF